jgi:type IV pilus assembly protein PilO
MDIDVKDPKLLRWAAAVLLVLVVVPVYFLMDSYSFTYKARNVTIMELDARHQQLSKDLERARLLVQNLEKVEQEYAILHDQWLVAQSLLPEQNQMPDLLRKVTAAGQQSGVEFQLFKPQTPVNQGFYSDNPIEVRIKGGFHQTGVFLSRLANLNRIVNVSDMNMDGVGNQDETPFTVETEMILTAYTQGLSTPVESLDPGNSEGVLNQLNAKADKEEAAPTQAGISK